MKKIENSNDNNNNNNQQTDNTMKINDHDTSNAVDSCKDDDEDEPTKIWSEFSNYTTSHGIHAIEHARSKFKKSLWIIIILASVIGLFINMYLLCHKYFKYEVDVYFKVEQAKSMVFPAVTICNLNPIKKSAYKDLQELQEILNSYSNEANKFNCTKNDTQASGTSTSKHAQCVPTSGKTEDGREERLDFQLVNKVQELYESLDDSIKYFIGHGIDELFPDCEFAGGMCSYEDFDGHINNAYGNCFTFNSVTLNKTLKTTKLPGPKLGLSIIFNVEQEEYIGEISQSAGLRVVVHDPRRMPFPEDEGILVSPNALTHIGVKMEKMSRLNGSYGNCYAEGLPKKTNYQKFHGLEYCQRGCQYTCISDEIYRNCSCIDIKFTFTEDEDSRKICSSNNETEKACVNGIIHSYDLDLLNCDAHCPPPCMETTYVTSVSSSMWPSDNYKKKLEKYIEMYYETFADENNSETHEINIKNVGKLVVYYESLAYTVINEVPSYELQQLLSDIGGVLGLYIGFSLLTIIEFIVLLYDLSWVGFFKRCIKKNSPKVNDKKDYININTVNKDGNDSDDKV